MIEPLHKGGDMSTETLCKVGQIAGAVFMIAGVASCQMGAIENTPMMMLLGGLIYGGSRLTHWLLPKK